jgi:hypothetical protein
VSTTDEFNAAFDKFARALWSNEPGEIHVDPGLAIKRTLALLRMVLSWSQAGLSIHHEPMGIIMEKAIKHLEPFEPLDFAREPAPDLAAYYSDPGNMVTAIARMYAAPEVTDRGGEIHGN